MSPVRSGRGPLPRGAGDVSECPTCTPRMDPAAAEGWAAMERQYGTLTGYAERHPDTEAAECVRPGETPGTSTPTAPPGPATTIPGALPPGVSMTGPAEGCPGDAAPATSGREPDPIAADRTQCQASGDSRERPAPITDTATPADRQGAAPTALHALSTRVALREMLDDLETPARFRSDRRPGEFASLRDGADGD